MAALDLGLLNERLTSIGDSDYWIHLQTSPELDKYPAKQHARAAAAKLGVESGLIYLAGAPTTYLEDSDQSVPFRQRRYFYYLSGSDEADNHLLYNIHTDELTIYIPKIDLHKAVWGGAGSTKAEAEAKYDADTIAYVSELESAVKTWWKTGDGKLYLLHAVHSVASINTSSPRVDSAVLRSAIDQCRVIKDDYEIKLVRQANKVSADAHRAVLEKIRSFENESQVEGIFLDTCVSEGAHNQAYNIIAGSGSNASVLHYGKNDEPLAGRQVLLIDAGAEWNCYASDVTRTFPISGYWTKEAEAIYDLVAKMQDTCISRIKPGTHYRDLQVLAHAIAAKGLLDLGILHNGTAAEILKAGTTLAFFPHGLGHHVGLEVHDVLDVPIQLNDPQEHLASASQSTRLLDLLMSEGLDEPVIDKTCIREHHILPSEHALYTTFNDPSFCMSPSRRDSPTLKEGMIVTVEPGIYFSKFALENSFLLDPVHAKYINKEVLARYMPVGGVRIEDDILVTKNGNENLTTAPKGDEAIEIIRGEKPSQKLAPLTQPEHLSSSNPIDCHSRTQSSWPSKVTNHGFTESSLSSQQQTKQAKGFHDYMTTTFSKTSEGLLPQNYEKELKVKRNRCWVTVDESGTRVDFDTASKEVTEERREKVREGMESERKGREEGESEKDRAMMLWLKETRWRDEKGGSERRLGGGDVFPVARDGGLMGGFPFRERE